MADELQVNLDKAANLQSELETLEAELKAKGTTDAGLASAIDAKKHQLTGLQEDIRKAKEAKDALLKQDQSKFEQVRTEHKQEAIKQLVARYPELSDASQLSKVMVAFGKIDSEKFEAAGILQDLVTAYWNANPDKFQAVIAKAEANDENIQNHNRNQAGGAGTYSPPEYGADGLTPYEQTLVREHNLNPEFVKSMRGKDTIVGGILTGKEKIAS